MRRRREPLDECVFRLRWVIAAGGAPLADAGLLVTEDRIAAIEPFSRLAGHRRVVDLGNVLALPPLVNAHTHWEFSALRQPLPATGTCTEWLEAVVCLRRQSSVPRADSLLQGLRESIAAGTHAVGEIATCDLDVYRTVAERFAQDRTNATSLHCVLFRELIGLRDDSVARAVRTAERHLGGTADTAASLSESAVATAGGSRATAGAVTPSPRTRSRGTVVLRRALSPHAPYSVREDLLAAAVALARQADVPLAIHFAEFADERELLARGTGPLRGFLERLGVCDGTSFSTGRTHRDLLQVLSAAPCILLIHGNHLTAAELAFLQDHPQFSLVYCPRTHAHFRHPPHPWQRAIGMGINVALGTDSRASNPDLSMLEELRFLRRSSGWPLTRLLPLATANALRALGLRGEQALCPGAPAVATVVTARHSPRTGDVDRWLLESTGLRTYAVRDVEDWLALPNARD